MLGVRHVRSREQGEPDAAALTDPDRRRALALAVWSTGVAVTGSVATRAHARATSAPSVHAPAGAAAPDAAPTTSPQAPRTPVAPSATPAREAGALVATAAPAGAGVLTGDALVLHVARRVSFGPTPALLAEIRSLGVDTWLEQQLQPASISDDDVDARLARLRDLDRSPAELRSVGRFGDEQVADLRVAAVLRAVESRRHLQEVMVDLWHDHLTASAAKANVAWHLATYDRYAIRPHALGRFTDLLTAATTSGAMLEYLDTTDSSAPDVNENHGRELLELHTVGRSSGFGPSDVIGAARVLSGWTIDPRTLTVGFDGERHHAGPATVLGWSTPGHAGDAGRADLAPMLQHLATHPATATRIASLLARRFVADDPPADLVASTAAAYTASGTDLAATLRHLFASTAFRRDGTSIVRRPFDLFAAQLRATGATMDVPNLVERLVPLPAELDPAAGPTLDATDVLDPIAEPLLTPILTQRPIADSVARVLRHNGQALFMAPSPAGFAPPGSRWSSGDALLRRWTLGGLLAQSSLPGITVDVESLAPDVATAGEAVDVLARRCLGTAPSVATRASALTAMGLAEGDPVDGPHQLGYGLAFLLAAPELQVR
jgi:uncharacterized protein (DUF1800 family)